LARSATKLRTLVIADLAGVLRTADLQALVAASTGCLGRDRSLRKS
jgi:hypothetical protein